MSLRRHTTLNLIGAAAPLVVSIATVPVYLRTIGAERFGTLAILWAILAYFGMFDFGFSRALTQRLAKLSTAPREERSRLGWTAIIATAVLSSLGGAVFWLASEGLVRAFFTIPDAYRQEVASATPWLVALLPITLLNSLFQGALQARLQFVTLNLTQVVASILGQTLPLAMAATGRVELRFLVLAIVSARLITLVSVGYLAAKSIPLIAPPIIDRRHLEGLLTYGGWVSITTVLAPLLVTFDRLVIASLAGPKAVAFYAVPYDVAFKTIIIAGSVAGALTPRLAAATSGDALELASSVTRIMLAAMTPFAVVAIIVAQAALRVWVGPATAESSQKIAEFIFLGIWFHAFATPHHSRLLSQDSPKRVVFIYLAEIPIYFLALWVGVTTMGIIGAALAWSLRVGLDATLILWAANVFRREVRAAWPSLLVVLGALAVALAIEGPLRYLLGLALFACAVLVNWRTIQEAIQTLRRKPATPG